MAQKNHREDDSAEAVKLDLDNAKQRLDSIENALITPIQLGKLVAPSIKESPELRKELSATLLELLDDYNNRKALEKIVEKIDRKWWNRAWRKGLAVVGAVLLVALGAFLQAYFTSLSDK